MSYTRHPGRRARAVLVAVGACAALVLTAAGASAQTGATGTSGRAFANGSVTSVHGTAVQVSNTFQNRESTVTLQPSTEYTKRESAPASAITVGTCVRVLGTGSATKGITAQSVSASAAGANGCAGPGGGTPSAASGAGPRGGFRFGNGQRPRNGGANRNRPANFAMAFGPVTSVSGDTLVVKSTTFVRPAATKSKTKAKGASTSKRPSSTPPKTTTSNVTVTLTNTSQISQTVSASASDVTVGSCVTATGTSNGGGVNADRVAISAPVNGQCTGGFGRFGGGGAGASGANGQV